MNTEQQTELETLRRRVNELEQQLAALHQRARRHAIGILEAIKHDDPKPQDGNNTLPHEQNNAKGATHLF